ncbi:hypothetical protein JKL49_00510 [Phenylobacterium sp. 20VBR1]|uniref:Uncharacterized protein n=1 Tax=Phenylobacterium glaciei TaxID=2803784 RepID=A0A941HUQ5_9CAUL|nr:hypothetical protein [Phenylobacterium glaciei]MBR7617853.1 hypothetical protein [Phenylobacterium glaciei]
MSWLTRTMLGLALALSAGAALAGCPAPCGQGAQPSGGYQDVYDGGGYVAGGGSYDMGGPPPGYAYDGGGYVASGGYAYDNGGQRPGCQTCSGHRRGDGDRRSGGYSLRTYGDVAQHYGYPSCGQCAAFAHERAYNERYDERGPCRAQDCGDCRQCGELILGGNFTYDYGVGPYPEGGYGGGGGGYASGGGFAGAGAGAGASASARASASASSSSHVSVNIGGRGGHKGGGGGCNTCGGGHTGGGGTW